jgi:hypothetical protein
MAWRNIIVVGDDGEESDAEQELREEYLCTQNSQAGLSFSGHAAGMDILLYG